MTIPQMSLSIALSVGWERMGRVFRHPVHGEVGHPPSYASSLDLMHVLEVEMDGKPGLQLRYAKQLRKVCFRSRRRGQRVAWLSQRPSSEWRAEAWLKTHGLWLKDAREAVELERGGKR